MLTIGSREAGTDTFLFDEPTTGLHFHDIKTLLKAFNALIDKGHTVVIIEHNMDVIKCADYLVDLGPEGGNAEEIWFALERRRRWPCARHLIRENI